MPRVRCPYSSNCLDQLENSCANGNESKMAEILVIGYGNTLRRDDALGPLIAEEVARRNCPGVLALAVPQLLPELAPALANARLVVFVDAAQCDLMQWQAVIPVRTWSPLHHTGDPTWLMSLTQALYGTCPDAWLLHVPAFDL